MNNMGLVNAARQIESYGRGPDKQLAHIAPDEAQFLDYLQGGRRENPHTGLPEYSLFGKILKAVVRVAAAVGGFVVSGGNPLAAAAASSAATKLTGGSWKQSLTSGAITGLTAGLGNLATSGGSAFMSNAGLSAVPGITVSGAPMNLAGAGATTGAATGISSAAAPAAAGGLGSAFSNMIAPIGGMTGVGVGLANIASPKDMSESSEAPTPLLPPPPPGFGNNINLNVSPLARAYQPFQGDYSKFGEGAGGGWKFFDNVNPQPKFLAHGGAVRRYALGGGVMNPRSPGAGLGGLGGLRNPGIPSQIQTPHFDDAQTIRAQAQDLSPAAQRENLRRAAILGYNSLRDGGDVHGAGDGKSDDVPALLSTGEHVFDASVVSDAGNGDSEAGHKVMEDIKAEIRRRAGRRHPRKPTPKQSGSARALVSKVM